MSTLRDQLQAIVDALAEEVDFQGWEIPERFKYVDQLESLITQREKAAVTRALNEMHALLFVRLLADRPDISSEYQRFMDVIKSGFPLYPSPPSQPGV